MRFRAQNSAFQNPKASLYTCECMSVCQFEISARIRLNSALVVGCLRGFLAALSKVFQKASLSLMKEQFSRLAKSAASNIFSYFVLFGYTGERLIAGL